MRILAVDDDETILDLLGEALRISGHGEMAKATSGQNALDVIANASQPFDCFLLDIQMPGIDGIKLCGMIRAIPDYARTPILMLTAMSQREYIERAFAAGATDYITKPFDFLELGARLSVARKLVEERSLVVESMAAIEGLKRTIKTTPRVALADPLEFAGVDRTMGYIAFENYVMSLGRAKLFSSSVTAIKVQEVVKLFDKSRPSEFVARLGIVAETLCAATEPDAPVIAYRGNGLFLCLSQGRTLQSPEEIEAEMNLALPDLGDQGLSLRVAAGQRFSLSAFTRYGSIQAIHRAADSAEEAVGLRRAEKALATPSTVRRLFRRSALEPDRNPYEVILRDVLQAEVASLRH